MSLREYKRKRDFKVTAEPGPVEGQREGGSSFVVQKHDASRLHYDFRLEMGGVLASWAVPKGFPTEKGERHLAVHVEDHPLDYAHFEGIIPAGQYGGGTVMVWDVGTYELLGGTPVEATREGLLHMMLSGEKLKGEWTLVRSNRDGEEKNWLLIKTGEGKAKISKKQDEHSVLSDRTLEQIAKQKTAVWDSNRGLAAEERAKATGHSKTRKPARGAKPAASARPPKMAQRRHADVNWVEPMKASLLKSPPTEGDWLYEIKWDGYRALILKNGPEVEIISRNHKSMTADFPEIRDAVAQLPAETMILDGEICALDAKGRPSFQLLQGREMGQSRPDIRLYAFDLLNLDGRSFLKEPLEERREALEGVIANASDLIRYSGALEGDVSKLLDKVRELQMEGIIGKQLGSLYVPGARSAAWIKLKVAMEQEFVIGGFTPPKTTRPYFGSVILGYYEKGKLLFVGKAGTGFNHQLLRQMHGQMSEMKIDDCPFANLPQVGGGRWSQALTKAEMRKCTWIRPELVAQVRFTEWTEELILRQPVFLGLRKDKSAREVVREVAK